MENGSQLANVLTLIKDIATTPIWSPRANEGGGSAEKQKVSTKFCLEGVIEAGLTSNYAIDGTDFVFDTDTLICGDLRIGSLAKVKGQMRAG